MINGEISMRIDEISARLSATTPGEWIAEMPFPNNGNDFDIYSKVAGGQVALSVNKEDAEFIVHAKADIQWLKSQVGSLESTNRSLWTAITLLINANRQQEERGKVRNEN